MSDQARGPTSPASSLPGAPSLEWLRKEAKRRLAGLRETNPRARLADAQVDLARQYGFPSWRALKAHVDSLTIEGEAVHAARRGDIARLGSLLEANPALQRLTVPPYAWTLLHVAAHAGQLAVVDLLLARGMDPDARERGDNTCAMHWAAAAGRADIVQRLIDAGGDVIGHGDDHELEVIGWATCWEGCDDAAHRAVVHTLIQHGARHHIFSAIAMNLASEVRRIVARDPDALRRRMSHNEAFQLPLHFAVRMNRPEMVALLLELGADPAATDGLGVPAGVYAANPGVEPRVIELLSSAGGVDLFSALSLGNLALASRLVERSGATLKADTARAGTLHLLAKRGDATAVKWLLDRGADANARWSHWDAEVTPMHLAASQGHAAIVHILLGAGADPAIRDSKHDGDVADWARFFEKDSVLAVLDTYARARRA